MSVTVLLFASLAEKAGVRRVELAREPGDTVSSVVERIFGRYPALRDFEPNLLYALDEEYAKAEASVPDGSTLALIPPVSGGAAC